MPRPPKEIKHKVDQRSGKIMVAFLEAPTVFHTSPEEDLPKALAWARRNRAKLLAGPEKPLRISDLARGFFDEDGEWYRDQVMKGRHMTRASLSIRQAHVVNYIIPLLGDEDPRTLEGQAIDRAILDAMRISARKGVKTEAAIRPLARGTRSKLLYSIKLMFDRWVSDGIVRLNPCNAIVKYSKEPERKRSDIPETALAKLFPPTHGELVRVWGSTLWGALMLVLFDTGARSGEVRALRWRDIDEEERYIPITKGIEAGTSATEKGTKSGVVKPGYVTHRTLQELVILKAESRYAGDDDYVFTLTGDAPVSGRWIEETFRRGIEGQGYDSTGWTPHWLRHTFITWAASVLDDASVLTLAGHTSLVTSALYRHPTPATMLRRTKGIRDMMDELREAGR